MGLIKTAMMTGGGIYAVNKLAKTTERHYEQRPSNNSQQQYGPNYPPQGYWGPPLPGQPQDGVAHWYPAPTNNSTSRALPIDNERFPPKYDYPYESFNDERQAQTTPAYVQQPQKGYVVPEEQNYDREQSSRRGSPLSVASGMAMEYVQNGKLGKGSSRKVGKEGGARDLLSQVFK